MYFWMPECVLLIDLFCTTVRCGRLLRSGRVAAVRIEYDRSVLWYVALIV